MNNQRIDELFAAADMIIRGNGSSSPQSQDKTELFIFGQPHHNLPKIIFEAFSLAPNKTVDGFFMKDCEFDIIHGDSEKIYQLAGKEKKEVDLPKMLDMLSQIDRSQAGLRFECITGQELFESINVHVVVSAEDYADVDWSYVQKNADYVLFSLSATAILSMCERKILRTTLLPGMGNELGVLLTNNNMLLSNDKELVNSSLSNMFGDFDSPVFRFPDEDEEKLVSFLKVLSKKHSELLEKKQKRVRKMELKELLAEITTQIEVLSSDNTKLDDAIELLNEKLQKLPDRQESAFRRVRMKYVSKLRIELSEAVSLFHQEFNKTLEKEISSNDDVREMESIIPDYIKTQWEKEANRLFARAKSYSETIGAELMDYINDDITSYISEGVSEDFSDYVFGLTKMYSKKQPNGVEPTMQVRTFDFELSKDNTKLKKYGVVASGVALVLMSHPIVGIAVAVLGSQKVAKDSEERFVAANKQALTDAAHKMCIDYHDEMDSWIEQITKHIESHIEQCIAECYQKVIDLMMEAARNKQLDFSNHDEELNKLKMLKKEIEAELN